jgi:hypothetical protein
MKLRIYKLVALQIVMEKHLGIAQLCLLLACSARLLRRHVGLDGGVSHTGGQRERRLYA